MWLMTSSVLLLGAAEQCLSFKERGMHGTVSACCVAAYHSSRYRSTMHGRKPIVWCYSQPHKKEKTMRTVIDIVVWVLVLVWAYTHINSQPILAVAVVMLTLVIYCSIIPAIKDSLDYRWRK